MLSIVERDYLREEIMRSDGTSELCWTCLDCGCLVGSLQSDRDAHEAWHSRLRA